MPSAVRLAVFDVDGTIIDSQHTIVTAMRLACERHGLTPPAEEQVRRIIGLSLLDAVTRLLPDARPEQLKAVVQTYKQGFSELRQRPDYDEPLFPDVMACFDALDQQGWQLAVATGKSRRGLAAMIERHDLQGRFVSLQTADDNPGKPHPAMLQRALSDAGAAPHRTVMIGDTSFDMAMAQAAGTRAIGVGWGYHAPDELLAAGAERVVSGYPELLRHLISLFDPVS